MLRRVLHGNAVNDARNTAQSDLVKTMHLKTLAIILVTTGTLAACGGAEQDSGAQATVDVSNAAPSVSFTPGSDFSSAGKPGGPVSVAYRIIGQPVVGQPIAIELRVLSALGTQPINVGYRINDASAMQLAESQPPFITVAPVAEGDSTTHQVTIVPLREGRLYLNVSASVETEEGTMSTVTAIPVQVGEGGREIEENGTLTTDENGESIRSLPADN